MSTVSIDQLLRETNELGGYPGSLVCTDSGLLVAAHGDTGDEELAGFTALFDDVVSRATRDLNLHQVDEVAVRDQERGRLVVRPVNVGTHRFFLVVWVPRKRTWRRYTNRLVKQLREVLAPLVEELEEGA